MQPLTLQRVAAAFSPTMFQRGRSYQRNGRVLEMMESADGCEITGRVRGSGKRLYQVRVTRHTTKFGFEELDTACSCPVAVDCKHAAALLLETVARPQRAMAAPGDRRNGQRAREGPANDLARARPSPGGAPPAARHGERAPSLPPEVTAWLDDVERCVDRARPDYPPQVRQRLLYLLTPADSWLAVPGEAELRLASARLLKDGRFSEHWTRYTADNVQNTAPAKFRRTEDLRLLHRLQLLRSPRGRGRFPGVHPLHGPDGMEILQAVLATGRCRWGEPNGVVLTQGPARTVQGVWRFEPDGRQRFRLDLPDGTHVIPTEPPWYVDPEAGLCGPVETGLDGSLAAALLRAPALEPDPARRVRQKLAARLSESAEALPRDPDSVRERRLAPKPRLRLAAGRYRVSINIQYGRHGIGYPITQEEELPAARMSFDYDGTVVPADSEQPCIVREQDDAIERIPRDYEAESQAVARLERMGFEPVAQLGYQPGTTGESPADLMPDPADPLGVMLDFARQGGEALRADGWSVEIDPDYALRVTLPDTPLDIAADATDSDWFDLHLGVEIDGERVDLLPILLKHIRGWSADDPPPVVQADQHGPDDVADSEQDCAFLPLPDGRLVAVPTTRIAPIARFLWELLLATGGQDDDRLRLGRVDAAALAQAAGEADAIDWNGCAGLLELGRKLTGFQGIPRTGTPPGFAGDLRGYQQEGVDWLQFLAASGLGGVLADDMGLGKTVQTLGHICAERAAGRLAAPVLIVAPTSVLANWRREAGTFAPELKVLVLHGPDRKSSFKHIAGSDIVVTSYPLLVRDIEELAAQDWHAVVLDEAQAIKNPRTAMARAACRLASRHRIALSGTPIENNLTELWSLFRFLNPGLFPDQRTFTKHFRTPIEKQGDSERREMLVRRCRPFVLRRTKAAVAAELPAKSEAVETVELERDQRDLYEAVRLTMHRRVREAVDAKGLARSHIVILDALLKLRQACCDPRLVKSATAKQKKASAKLARLRELLAELAAEERQTLVFSQFTSMLDLIAETLRADGLTYTMLTGQTPSRRRESEVARFQRGEVPIFLVSLKAGGTGLNLTAADTVIHYDPWWNPAVETQATDRAHRIGQTRPVFVHKLIARDTVEEKILDLHARKRALAETLFAPDSDSAYGITTEDLEFLFAR